MLRNWRMLAIAIVAVGVALWSTSSGDWLRVVAVSFVAIGVGLNLVAIGANGGRIRTRFRQRTKATTRR